MRGSETVRKVEEKMIRGIKNAVSYVKGRGFIRADIRIENGLIAEIGEGVCTDGVALPYDAMLLPAFIDVHIHGAGGADCTDGTVPALKKIASELATEGTASFLPTLMTQPQEKLCNSAHAIKQFMDAGYDGCAEALGVHLEGPFLADNYGGGQPRDFVHDRFDTVYGQVSAACGHRIKIVTLAPEITGYEFIRSLCGQGVNVSIGHSGCPFAMAKKSVEEGARAFTHTFNAQRGFHHREAGVVGAALLDDHSYCEVIADCLHVSVPAMQLLTKCKPSSKVLLVTDSVRAKGASADYCYREGGLEVRYQGGEVRLPDGTLAGSVLKMNVALKNMVQQVRVPLEQAILYCTENPAKYLNEERLGVVAAGKQADFTVLNGNFDVLLTIKKGKIIYKNCQLFGT